MGCRPRARSVLRCHGVLVLRHGPPREHKQAGRWPMKGGQSPSLELVSREFRKQRLAPWAADRGPDASFAAMVFWCSDTVLQESTGKLAGGRYPSSLSWCFGAATRSSKRWAKSPREHGQAGRWPMKGGQSPSLELVSREFRKQRLAPWAADRGPDPSFAAMVFWCCDTVLQENTSKLAGGR